MQDSIEEKAEKVNLEEKDRYIWVSSALKWQQRFGYFDIMEWSGIVCNEYSKGLNTLPCGAPYSNKTGWGFDSNVITVWDLFDSKEDNKFRALDEMPNQWCKRRIKMLWLMVSKQPTDEGAKEQYNDQHQVNQENHFRHIREQFQRNEMYDRLIAIYTIDYAKRDVKRD